MPPPGYSPRPPARPPAPSRGQPTRPRPPSTPFQPAPRPSNPVVTGTTNPAYWQLATQRPGAPGPNTYNPPALPSGGGGAPPAPSGPGGNWFDASAGPHGEWKDAYGNVIPHMNYGYNDQGQRESDATPQGAGPGAPAVPGVGAVPPAGGPYDGVFYSPTTGQNTLTLPQNFMQMLDPATRAGLNAQLQNLGFTPTGTFGAYGESVFMRPPEFDATDLERLSDPNFRQWLRFFLGQLGWGISYNLPGPWRGPGLPPAPPSGPPAPPTGGLTPAPASGKAPVRPPFDLPSNTGVVPPNNQYTPTPRPR